MQTQEKSRIWPCPPSTLHSHHPFPKAGSSASQHARESKHREKILRAPRLPHPAEKLAKTPRCFLSLETMLCPNEPRNAALHPPNPGLTQGDPQSSWVLPWMEQECQGTVLSITPGTQGSALSPRTGGRRARIPWLWGSGLI